MRPQGDDGREGEGAVGLQGVPPQDELQEVPARAGLQGAQVRQVQQLPRALQQAGLHLEGVHVPEDAQLPRL